MKNKIKTCATIALAGILAACALSSCGMNSGETGTEKPSSVVGDIGEDIKDGANDIADDIKDGVNDIKDGVEDILPDKQNGDQTGKNGDAYTADENNGMGNHHRGGK